MTFVKIRSEGVAWQTVDDELVVLDEQRSLYLRLVGAAGVLWPALVEGATVEALALTLVRQFDLDDDQARRDVDAFVEQLTNNDLLEPVS